MDTGRKVNVRGVVRGQPPTPIKFKPGDEFGPYQARQLGVVVRCPGCACGGLLDYAYWCWWKCRACGEWVKRW